MYKKLSCLSRNTLWWQKQENTIYFNYRNKAKTHSRGKNKKITIYFNYIWHNKAKTPSRGKNKKIHSYEQMEPFPRYKKI